MVAAEIRWLSCTLATMLARMWAARAPVPPNAGLSSQSRSDILSQQLCLYLSLQQTKKPALLALYGGQSNQPELSSIHSTTHQKPTLSMRQGTDGRARRQAFDTQFRSHIKPQLLITAEVQEQLIDILVYSIPQWSTRFRVLPDETDSLGT
jgi:hypothetical protein